MLFIAIWFETHRRRHRGAFIESLGIISDRIELYFSTISRFHAQSVINVLQLTCPVHVILHEDPLLPTSGCRNRQQQGTTSLINKHLLNWSTLGVYFTTFLFQRADCLTELTKMNESSPIAWTRDWMNQSNRFTNLFRRVISSISHTALCVSFCFPTELSVGAGPFSSIFDFNKKIPIKRRYYFAPLVTSSLAVSRWWWIIRVIFVELFSDWLENDRRKYSFETNTIHFQLIPIYFPSLSW